MAWLICPTLVLGLNFIIVGAERAENRVKRSGAERWERIGAVSGRCRKTMERSGGRRARTELRAGVTEIGWSAERLFLPLTLRSHALVRGAPPDDDDNDDDDDYDYERSKNLKKTTYLRTYHTLPLAVTVIIRLLTVTSWNSAAFSLRKNVSGIHSSFQLSLRRRIMSTPVTNESNARRLSVHACRRYMLTEKSLITNTTTNLFHRT